MQPSGKFLDPTLLPAVFPPHEHLAEVDRRPNPRDFLLKLFKVPEVVDDEEVFQLGERRFLDVTRDGVRERGERIAEHAHVHGCAESGDDEEVGDSDEVEGFDLRGNRISIVLLCVYEARPECSHL